MCKGLIQGICGKPMHRYCIRSGRVWLISKPPVNAAGFRITVLGKTTDESLVREEAWMSIGNGVKLPKHGEFNLIGTVKSSLLPCWREEKCELVSHPVARDFVVHCWSIRSWMMKQIALPRISEGNEREKKRRSWFGWSIKFYTVKLIFLWYYSGVVPIFMILKIRCWNVLQRLLIGISVSII